MGIRNDHVDQLELVGITERHSSRIHTTVPFRVFQENGMENGAVFGPYHPSRAPLDGARHVGNRHGTTVTYMADSPRLTCNVVY